jgi:hypothetical protein
MHGITRTQVEYGRYGHHPARIFLVLALLSASFPGCGYHLAGYQTKPPGAIRTFCILPLKNKTTTARVEQFMTKALVEQFSERTSMKITSERTGADAVLEAEVSGVSAAPILYSPEGFANTYLLTILASLRIIRSRDGVVLYENPGFQFRDQYLIHSDIRYFFSEQNATMERMARDFASSVATLFLETQREIR